jgi:3',5'-cyclic AMP phosphodiesterase CpdA
MKKQLRSSLGLILLLLPSVMPARVRNEELVTVTDTSFAVTWATSEPSPGRVRYGTSAKTRDQVAEETGQPTRFHYIEVKGLQPETAYFYRCESGKEKGHPRKLSPGRLATLTPPAGRLLFVFAIMSDPHAGEDVAGLFVLPVSWLPPVNQGYTWRYPIHNYWQFTNEAAVADINSSAAELTVVTGDLTSWFTAPEFKAMKDILDQLQQPYSVIRGNHDRVENYPEDYFLKVFGLQQGWYSFDHQGFHFVCLDDNRLSDGYEAFPEEEFQWFERDLAAHRQMPTFVFVHRPIAANWIDVYKDIRTRFLAILAQNPQVVGVFNGHSHRAKVTVVPETGSLPHIEVPSTKEYPVGYALVRVYEGGFMYNFFETHCDDCREWNDITRGENFHQAPRMLMKSLEDRNFVYQRPLERR